MASTKKVARKSNYQSVSNDTPVVINTLQFADKNNPSNKIYLTTPDAGTMQNNGYTIKLPTTQGNENQILKKDKNGHLAWTDKIIGGGNWRTWLFTRTLNSSDAKRISLSTNWAGQGGEEWGKSTPSNPVSVRIKLSHTDNDNNSVKDWLENQPYGDSTHKGIINLVATHNPSKRLTGKVTKFETSSHISMHK